MEWEYTVLNAIRENMSSGPMDAIMKGITFLGEAGWFWIVLGIVLAAVPKTRRIGFTVLGALLLSLIVCNITIKPIVERVRPYDFKEGIEIIISKPTDYSFPSGHAAASFAAAVALFMCNKKWGTGAVCLAALIAFSRLYLFVHYPTDVIAGIVLGTLFGVISYYVVGFIFRKINEKRKCNAAD